MSRYVCSLHQRGGWGKLHPPFSPSQPMRALVCALPPSPAALTQPPNIPCSRRHMYAGMRTRAHTHGPPPTHRVELLAVRQVHERDEVCKRLHLRDDRRRLARRCQRCCVLRFHAAGRLRTSVQAGNPRSVLGPLCASCALAAAHPPPPCAHSRLHRDAPLAHTT